MRVPDAEPSVGREGGDAARRRVAGDVADARALLLADGERGRGLWGGSQGAVSGARSGRSGACRGGAASSRDGAPAAARGVGVGGDVFGVAAIIVEVGFHRIFAFLLLFVFVVVKVFVVTVVDRLFFLSRRLERKKGS